MNSFSFNSTFPHCPLHKSNYLSWVCLDQNCDTRIFCPHCVILNHKNIHSHFNEFSSILKDPLCQIIGSDFLLQSNREKSLKDILSEYFDSQKDKLRDVLDKILNEIMKKFEDIRIGFQKDVHTFLKQNEVNMNKFDQQRKEYDEFFQNYYLNNNFERERLKEGMDLILSKYNSNENFKKSLAEVLSNVTHVIDKDYKEISMGNIKLHNLSWSYFTDKKMKIDGNIKEVDVEWANKEKILCSNNYYDTTMSSNEPLPDFFKIKIKIIEMSSKDIIIGLCNKRFQCSKSERSFLTNVDGESSEYGYDPKSNGYKFSYQNKQEEYGVTCEVGDFLSIIYKNDKTISFKRNKQDMGVAFLDAKGPFYLAASFFKENTKLEIVKCKEI